MLPNAQELPWSRGASAAIEDLFNPMYAFTSAHWLMLSLNTTNHYVHITLLVFQL